MIIISLGIEFYLADVSRQMTEFENINDLAMVNFGLYNSKPKLIAFSSQVGLTYPNNGRISVLCDIITNYYHPYYLVIMISLNTINFSRQ